jgi:hypothetical protein
MVLQPLLQVSKDFETTDMAFFSLLKDKTQTLNELLITLINNI